MRTGLEHLLSCFEQQPVDWQTSCRERAALLGISALLRPHLALEIGVWHGGFTRHLIDFCGTLICVDPVKQEEPLPEYAHFQQTTSDLFFAEPTGKAVFDLIVLDADHSTEHAYRDMVNCINHGKVIVAHDSFNPDCRAGYFKAISENNEKILWHNLDYVQGDIFNGVQWGGLALVVVK